MDSPNGLRGHAGGGDIPPNLIGGDLNINSGWKPSEQSNQGSAGLSRFNPLGAHS